MTQPVLRAACACGEVALEARGAPITTAVCYCQDCQAAGRQIEALPGAPAVLDPDAGTALVLFRKDRFGCVKGAERLTPVKLTPASPTSRYVASCCNAAMYLGFDDARHWVDVFRGRVEGSPPPIRARVCTRFRPAGAEPPKDASSDAPSYPGYPARFILSLLASRLAMLFGR